MGRPRNADKIKIEDEKQDEIQSHVESDVENKNEDEEIKLDEEERDLVETKSQDKPIDTNTQQDMKSECQRLIYLTTDHLHGQARFTTRDIEDVYDFLNSIYLKLK